GIDKDIITYIDAGYIAEEEGCAAVTLHARFLKQMYSGYADWSKIKDLKSRLTIKVIGNGDVKTSEDAKRMFEETGADAVAIGRGALGRPWIFYQIASDLGFTNKKIEYPKTFDEIVKLIFEHANLLIDYLEDETLAVKNLRKFLIWYFKGQPVGKQFRSKLVKVKTVKELEKLLAK
ncbi:MAG: tRNA-dihydrouridine synthase, partial [Bifidobacteriaceae bacterium]|nr:tRNA-dihydrouridine synthase [Bifidobacteriaceae bacterium]